MAANLGTLTLDLVARIGGFTAPLDQAQRHAQQRARAINSALASIGAGISIVGITTFVKSGIDALDNLNDLSLKTGASVETLSGFSLAAKQSGTDLESLGNALNKLSINIAKNREEFAALGISAKDPTEAFLQFADVFNSIEDAQDKAAFGAKVLGKSYAELAPLASMTSEQLRNLITQGQAASGATTELAQAADEFNDSMEKMQAILTGLSITIAGPIIKKFNQFADTMAVATESGVNLINVIAGILDFGKRNYFTGFADIQTDGIDALNSKIERAKGNLQDVQKNSGSFTGGVGGSILTGLLGTDKQITKAQTQLDGLIAQRDKLLSTKPKDLPSSTDVKKFIGGGGAGSEIKIKRASAGRSSGISEEQRAAEQLQKSYESMLESLTKELALHGENSKAAKLQYEIINGGLKGISTAQANNLLDLQKQQDALERQDKQWAALIESANEFYDIRKSTDDLIASGDVQTGFNDQLAKIADSDLGAEQKKEQFDKLGIAFNDQFIEPAKEGTDQLSEFTIQAARNMESAFADFLFDPFNESMGGLVDNFATALRRMAADYLSSTLFNLLQKGLTSSGSSGSGFFDSLAGAFSSGGQGASDAAFLASAKGNMFNSGNVIPFANGGVFNAATFFPMKGGKTGVMGEAGPEAIMPLSRGPDGKLGIKGSSGGGQSVNIVVNVQGGSAPDVRRSAAQGAREAIGFLGGAQRYG